MNSDLKKDFPMLLELSKKGQAYLDSAATAQKPDSVIKAVKDLYERDNFPVRRSVYSQAEALTAKVESVREQICTFLGAGQSYQVVFTASATDSINLVARSFEKLCPKNQRNVVVTAAEHHSNFAPWVQAVGSVEVVSLPESGFFSAKDFQPFVHEKVGLLAVTLDSNVIGPVWEPGFEQLKQLIKIARKNGAKVLLDATQAVAHTKLNLEELDADFVVFSGHKMAGPNGVGVLCAKNSSASLLEPIRIGGGNIETLSADDVKSLPPPHGLEAGTLPVAQIIGLSEAIKYLEQKVLVAGLYEHEAELCRQVIDFLQSFEGVKVISNPEFIKQTGHVVSFYVEGIHPHDFAWSLGQNGVLVRAGDHCARPIHEQLGVPASVRVSFFAYSDLADVERFKKAFKKTIEFFRSQGDV